MISQSLGTVVVPPVGPTNTTIAFVGEAPGAQEERHNPPTPFVGPAGQRFDRFLSDARILRSSSYITNVMKIRPPKNDFKYFWRDSAQTKPTDMLAEGVRRLKDELASLPNLQVVVALGRQPMYVLTGRDGILNNRGSILFTEGLHERTIKVIPTLHPAFVLRMWAYHPLVVHDFKRAKYEATYDIGKPKYKLNWNPSYAEVVEFFDRYREERDAHGTPIAADIECHTGEISRVSFCYDGFTAISVKFIDVDTSMPVPNSEVFWPVIKDVLEKSNVIGHHFTFDMIWLLAKQGIYPNLTFDTMIAQHVILPGLPKKAKPLALAMLTSLYTRIPFYKDEGKSEVESRIGPYSALDALVTCKSAQEQTKNPRFDRAVFQHEMDIVTGPIMYMMRRGILVNKQRRDALRERYHKELEYLELRCCEIAGDYVNLRSPKQVASLLYDKLGLKGGKKRSTDAESIFVLKARYPECEALKVLALHRKVSKIYDTVLSAKLSPDSRMYTSYFPTNDGGRFKSYANPLGYGCNMQNVVRPDKDPNIRPMFMADHGRMLIECDLEQAELRAVAYFCDDTKLISLLESGSVDVHTWMANKILGKPEGSKISVAERQLGKKIVHTGNYLGTATSLVKSCRIELGVDMKRTTAQLLLATYYSRFNKIPIGHNNVKHALSKNNRTLVNPFGRRHTFFDAWGDDLFRAAVAWLPQSTIADLLNRILLKWFNRYGAHSIDEAEKGKPEVMIQLHDAFYCQCFESRVDQTIEELKDAFDYPFRIGNHKNVIIPMKFKVSKRWGE